MRLSWSSVVQQQLHFPAASHSDSNYPISRRGRAHPRAIPTTLRLDPDPEPDPDTPVPLVHDPFPSTGGSHPTGEQCPFSESLERERERWARQWPKWFQM